MKIVQTFWSGGANPLEKAYGWPLPEYNMMSWVLSCLTLRKSCMSGEAGVQNTFNSPLHPK